MCTFTQKRIAVLERRLLEVFNDQQEIEGFTVADDSEEIYQAKDGNDDLFKEWVSDCRLDDAIKYNELIGERNE